MIGSYGNIIFEVSSEKILNLTDLSTTYGGNWVSQDLIFILSLSPPSGSV